MSSSSGSVQAYARANSGRCKLVLLLLLTPWLWAAQVARADPDAYPTKPVRFIVPTAPGGATDALARLLANELTRSWGQQVIVDNRSGGHGIIAMQLLALEPPDGYTIMMGNIGVIAINPGLYSKLPYDTLRDFAPVSLTTKQPFVLGINAAVPAQSLATFIEYARARPGKLFYGSGGNGSGTHVAMEMLKQRVGINLTHVPYKGGGLAINDVVAGQVQACLTGASALLPHLGSGKIRLLAVSSSERLSVVPQVPTFSESGIQGFEVSQWQGVLTPAKIAPGILNAIYTATAKALRTERVRALMGREGMDVIASTPKEFSAFIRSETAEWGKVIKTAGIRID
jgi:tripartite-type tricarboxylate transporter receptor subunit TctC